MKRDLANCLSIGDNTPVVLNGVSDSEIRITSIELVKVINYFRSEEGNMVEKEHKHLMRDIRTEIDVLKTAGISQSNFGLTEYTDAQSKQRPCYSMNKAGALQLLNKESAVVRYKTTQYIESLENKQQVPMSFEDMMIKQLEEQKKIKQQLNQINANALTAVSTANEVRHILDNQMTINTTQQAQIRDAVSKRVTARLEACEQFDCTFDKAEHKSKFYSNLWNDLKRRFGVARYGYILHVNFDEAINFAKNWIEPADIR